MRNPWIVLPLAAACVMVIFLSGGCAPKTQVLRDNGPAAAVRPPAVKSMEVRLLSERPEAPPQLPYSVADETRGRWLTLFEVTVSPVSAGALPDTGSAEDPDTPSSGPAPDL
ncbi:MAG: hypothetical protein OEM47_06000 [Deltaproteobacteria bacterium]|nr:hypothetical protein [Deltaproteobacteria bacterium]